MVVDGEASEEVEINSVLTEGSVILSIFFLGYKNDMAEYTKHSSVRLFAHDTIIYLTLSAENYCKKLQEDLQALARWGDDWLMKLHPDKCSVIRLSRKKTIHRYDKDKKNYMYLLLTA